MPHIDLATIKLHLRVSSTSEDTLIEDFYFPAALEWIEGYTGIAATEKEVTQNVVAKGLTNLFVSLESIPVTEILSISQGGNSIAYESEIDANGRGCIELLADESLISIIASGGEVIMTADGSILTRSEGSALDTSSTAEDVAITYKAGYAAGDLPAGLKQAALFMTSHFFVNRSQVDLSSRQTIAEVPRAATDPCDAFRTRIVTGA